MKTLWSQWVEAWFCPENEDVIECMVRLGNYEPVAWIKPHLGSVFVDVGAFVGAYTLLAAKAIGSAGRVIALEPDQTNRRQLERNLSLNNVSNTTVLPLAAWSRTGPVPWHHDPDHPNWHKVDEWQGTDVAEAVTLDDLVVRLGLPRVDWIKLDIEGAEVEVLRGADKTLRGHSPTLFIEVHNTLPALEDLLHQHGYRIERAVFEEEPENHGYILARSIGRVQN
jgi:FkbM family methyltransferase